MSTENNYREEMERSVSRTKKVTAITAVLIVLIIVVSAFAFPGQGYEQLLDWQDSQLVIHCPDDTTYTLPYAQIQRILLIHNAQSGKVLSGANDRSCHYGLREDPSIGQYVLCAHKSFETVIELEMPDGIYRISYESPETTKLLFDALEDLLKQWENMP